MHAVCVIIRYLPLGDVRTLFTTQVIFVNLLACCYLSEPCGAAEVQTVLVTMLGMIMVTNPPLLFGAEEDSDIAYDSTYYAFAFVSLVGAFFMAVSFVACRYLRQVHPNVLAAWGGAVGIVPSLVLARLVGGPIGLPSFGQAPLVVLMGTLSYASQAMMVTVLQVEQAGTASVVRRALDILLAFLLQVTWFGQVPGTVPMMGSLLITVTIVFEGWRKNKKMKSSKKECKE